MNDQGKWKVEGKVVLNYEGLYFSADNFKAAELGGEETALFVFTEEMHYLRSVSYSVYGMDKQEGVLLNPHGGSREYCLHGQDYILADKGTSGFETEQKLFICSLTKSGGQITVDITEARDAQLLEELAAKLREKALTLSDYINERAENCTASTIEDSGGAGERERLERFFANFRDTGFLDISPDDKEYRYYCIDYLNYQQDKGHNVSYRYFEYIPDYGYGRNSKLLLVPADGAMLAAGELTELSLKEIRSGKRLLADISGRGAKHEGEAVLLRVEEMFHDMNGLFWIKAKIICRFPKDGDKIKAQYPEAYKLINGPVKPRVYEVLDEAPAEGKLGDKKIAVRYYDHLEHGYVEKGLFQFSFCNNNYVTDFGPGRRYLRSGSGASASAVRHGGELYIAVYRCEKVARFKRDLYAMYKFYRFVSVRELLADDDGGALLRRLGEVYKYLAARGLLAPVDIDEDTFYELEAIK
jgi:hypothetical protein